MSRANAAEGTQSSGTPGLPSAVSLPTGLLLCSASSPSDKTINQESQSLFCFPHNHQNTTVPCYLDHCSPSGTSHLNRSLPVPLRYTITIHGERGNRKGWAVCYLLTLKKKTQPFSISHLPSAGLSFVHCASSTAAWPEQVRAGMTFPGEQWVFCIHLLSPTHILSPHFQAGTGILNILGFLYCLKGGIKIFQKLFSFGKELHFPIGKGQSGKQLKFWSSFLELKCQSETNIFIWIKMSWIWISTFV